MSAPAGAGSGGTPRTGEPGPTIFHLLRGLLRWLPRPFFPVRVDGGSLPATAFVGVFNHSSALDVVAMARVADRPCGFFAKAELRRAPLLGWLLGRAGGVFVARGQGDEAALEEAVRRLRTGRPFYLAPEGTRHHAADGRSRARTGFVRLAQLAGVPVLPVAISGAREALPPGAWLPRPGRLRVRIGAPLRLPPLPVDLEHREALQLQADQVLAEIYRLKAELET
jgi:1-acyl-sn-glycerol-3-phosphate acyltransferase